jgi:hypothetical protein
VSQVAEKLRVSRYVALWGRVETNVTDVVREIGMSRNVAQQRGMIGHCANGQRQGPH